MRAMMAHEPTLSHFAPRANLLPELEEVFRSYSESGTGRTRHYAHDDADAARYAAGEDYVPLSFSAEKP